MNIKKCLSCHHPDKKCFMSSWWFMIQILRGGGNIPRSSPIFHPWNLTAGTFFNHPTEKGKIIEKPIHLPDFRFLMLKTSGEQWWAILKTLVASEHVLSVAMSRSPRLSTVEDHARRALVCWTVEQGAGFFWPKAPLEFYLDWLVWWLAKVRNFITNGCFNGDVPW